MRIQFHRNVSRRAGTPGSLRAIRRSRRLGGWGLILFGLLFMAIGGVATWLLSFGVWQRVMQSADWPEVQAVIVSSEVVVSRSSDSTNYRPHIVYRYRWQEREYTAENWSFIRISSGRGWAEDKVAAYRPGTEHTAWVNPADPDDAVLEREMGWWLLVTFLPLLFVVVGLGLAVGGIVMIRGSSGSAQRRRGDSLADTRLRDFALLGLPEMGALLRRSGTMELKPEQGPLTRLLGTAVFALFWNGITWTILGILIAEGRRRDSYELFPILFLSIFAVIGAIAVFVFLYYLLGYFFGPRIRLVASQSVLIPGKPWELTWSFIRGTGRVRGLRMELNGATEADYTRGSGKNSSRVTDRVAFLRQTMIDSDNTGEILRGNTRIDIAPDLPHSFAARNNRICYRLNVTAVAAWTPNLSQSYLLFVPTTSDLEINP